MTSTTKEHEGRGSVNMSIGRVIQEWAGHYFEYSPMPPVKSSNFSSSDKIWTIAYTDQGFFIARWGRRSQKPNPAYQAKIQNCGSEIQAHFHFAAKIREKTNEGYREVSFDDARYGYICRWQDANSSSKNQVTATRQEPKLRSLSHLLTYTKELITLAEAFNKSYSENSLTKLLQSQRKLHDLTALFVDEGLGIRSFDQGQLDELLVAQHRLKELVNGLLLMQI